MYYCQIQFGMFVTNLKKCDMILYSSFDDTIVTITVPFNKDLVLSNYVPKLQAVYFMHMLHRICENEDEN